MTIVPTKIPDVKLVQPRIYGDARGWFMETWELRKFAEAGISTNFVQDNHSYSQRGTLRGLHYQIQQPQGKLVRVALGEIFDVAVDLRRNSATFGQWVGAHLSAENKHQLWVPPGFAHGFYVLSESAECLYKCSDFYAPQYECCLLWNDPALNITWPLAEGLEVLLSDKDKKGRLFDQAEVFD
jgi:dTDP-4-dehydrorhamnose 3,5-epimerase